MWSRTVGGGGELAACCEAICHEALEEDGVQVRTAEIDGGGVASGARADDDLQGGLRELHIAYFASVGVRTTFECILVLLGTTVVPLTGAILSDLECDVD